MNPRSCLGTFVVILALASPADATTLLVTGSGFLTGATGVNVGGTLYDVEFVEGTCVSLFDGCDSVKDFDFTPQSDASVASQALLKQVFIDDPASTPSGQTSGISSLTASVSRTNSDNSSGTAIKGRFLAFNDFHGALDPPIGSGGLINGTPAGGAEYLVTHVKRLRAAAEADGEKVITVGAGDMVGASPLVSAAFHDEPTVEILSSLGLDDTAAGEHEFDEGVAELRRLQGGGCHPIDGCQDGDPFARATFRYLVANVVDKTRRLPVLLPADVTSIQDIPIGIVGITLKSTPSLVNPAGIQNVDFLDEVETANFYAGLFSRAGVKALVLLIHEGGLQNPPPAPADPSACANFTGRIATIVAGLRPEYGIVISGHTHRSYTCVLPNSSGANSVVTSAGSFGTLITSIGFTLDKKTKRFASISAQNVIVENGILLPDGTWAKDEAGNFIRNPNLVDPDAKGILDKYRTAVAPLANRVVGLITADITRITTPAGESPLGDVVADAQLAYTTSAGAQIALVSPGVLRADLNYAFSPGGEAPGQITYGETFSVQPFNDLVVTQTFTGAQIKSVLEQQFAGFAGQTTTRILQVSAGFTYSHTTSAALGSKISNISLGGVPIDPAATYRVTTSSFLANGGDGFSNLAAGTQRSVAPGFDVDALVAHIGANSPVPPGPVNRVTRF